MASANTIARRAAENAAWQARNKVADLVAALAAPTVASTRVTDARATYATAKAAGKAAKVTERGF